MLQTMQQTMVNMQNAQPQALPPSPRDILGDFQRTKLPSFSHSVEPMDVDDWLKTVEKKLQVVQCNSRERVLLASHQLTQHAADWWDAYVEAHEKPDTINWNELKMAFRSHHIALHVWGKHNIFLALMISQNSTYIILSLLVTA
jgi:hypothetical protein